MYNTTTWQKQHQNPCKTRLLGNTLGSHLQGPVVKMFLGSFWGHTLEFLGLAQNMLPGSFWEPIWKDFLARPREGFQEASETKIWSISRPTSSWELWTKKNQNLCKTRLAGNRGCENPRENLAKTAPTQKKTNKTHVKHDNLGIWTT